MSYIDSFHGNHNGFSLGVYSSEGMSPASPSQHPSAGVVADASIEDAADRKIVPEKDDLDYEPEIKPEQDDDDDYYTSATPTKASGGKRKASALTSSTVKSRRMVKREDTTDTPKRANGYDDEHDSFILKAKEHGMVIGDITKAFNRKFDANRTVKALSCRLNKLQIMTFKWSDDQVCFSHSHRPHTNSSTLTFI